MKLEHGTIYFVLEKDAPNKARSPLVKIGLVGGDRSPYRRLAQHQTGNPRHLAFDEKHFVQTLAVEYVESQLHARFAAQRVSGEWFNFPRESDLESAVEVARQLAESLGIHKDKFIEAERLNNSLSAGSKVPSSAESNDLAREWLAADAVATKGREIIDLVASEIKFQATTFGPETVKDFAYQIVTLQEPAFSTTKFKEKNPQIWLELCDVVPQAWNPKFEVTYSGQQSETTAEVMGHLADLERQALHLREQSDVFGLNEIDLEIRQIVSPAEWHRELAEVQLKLLCGLAPGIEGVCEWLRVVKTRRKFDPEKLRTSQPALYESFVIPRKPKTSTVRNPVMVTKQLLETSEIESEPKDQD